MLHNLFVATLGCCLLAAGTGQGPSGCQSQQGIAGRIMFESGNQMPSPDLQKAPAKGVKRELLVYELVNRGEVTEEGNGFYSELAKPPLKTVSSNADGSFSVKLDPGRYSLFVREKGKLYANLYDGEGNIFPVEVKKGEIQMVEFKINYAAAY